MLHDTPGISVLAKLNDDSAWISRCSFHLMCLGAVLTKVVLVMWSNHYRMAKLTEQDGYDPVTACRERHVEWERDDARALDDSDVLSQRWRLDSRVHVLIHFVCQTKMCRTTRIPLQFLFHRHEKHISAHLTSKWLRNDVMSCNINFSRSAGEFESQQEARLRRFGKFWREFVGIRCSSRSCALRRGGEVILDVWFGETCCYTSEGRVITKYKHSLSRECSVRTWHSREGASEWRSVSIY